MQNFCEKEVLLKVTSAWFHMTCFFLTKPKKPPDMIELDVCGDEQKLAITE